MGNQAPPRLPEQRQQTDSWFREPRQARSQETLDRFLDATGELLVERDFDDITVADIVRSADRTVGSFYARFEDKDAVLFALHLRNLEADTALVAAFFDPPAWIESDLRTVIEVTTGVMIKSYRNPRPSFRAVVLRAATDAQFLDRCREAVRFVGDAWRDLLLSRASEIGRPGAPLLIDRCYRNVIAVLNQELLYGTLVGPELTTEELAADLTDMTARILELKD